MPMLRGLTTWFAINAANDTSPSGITDPVTGQPIYIPDLNEGVYVDLTNYEAAQISDTLIGTLYNGRYRRIRVDSGATAANVKTGTIGLMPSFAALAIDGVPSGTPSSNVVTSYDQGIAAGVRPVVFLNAITPGNWGWVQELGFATILYNATIQKATPAIGDLLDSVAGGLVNDLTAQAYATTSLGKAITLPAAGGLGKILLTLPTMQD